MLNTAQIKLIQASVPVLQVNGVTLAANFYRRLFEARPELLNQFNRTHQALGTQQRAFAGALLAFAENAADPDAVRPVLRRIAERHVSAAVTSGQYPVVIEALLESLKALLGEGASPELIEAWRAACGELAQTLIAMEDELREAQAARGGWAGWRSFECVNRVQEAKDVVSFYFRPSDGGALPEWEPGQYVTLRLYSQALQVLQPRQYTLSQPAGSGMLRITVKQLIGRGGAPDGLVSSALHRRIRVGERVEMTAPTGSFVLDDVRSEHPLVLIAAGIGITPMVPMLEALAVDNPLRRVHFLYSTQNAATYPLRREVEGAMRGMPNAGKGVFFTQPGDDDRIGRDYDAAGRITPAKIRSFCQDPDADFYLCGPEAFMKEVREALIAIGVIPPRIHTLSFGNAVA